MNTWTIIATLITGAVFGIALMCGIIFLCIKSYDKETTARRERIQKRRAEVRVEENHYHAPN